MCVFQRERKVRIAFQACNTGPAPKAHSPILLAENLVGGTEDQVIGGKVEGTGPKERSGEMTVIASALF